MDLYEALYTTRAMRRVSSDPIPTDIVQAMLDAAVRSPSGGNSQNWRWLTVTDRDTVASLGALYAEGWEELNATFYKGKKEAAIASGDEATKRVLSSSQWLADNFDRVPLVVLPYHLNDPTGASIYPAVWSFMLALRERGLATCLTTNHLAYEREVAELLGIPFDSVNQACLLPVAYAQGTPFRPANRAPLESVVHLEQWGGQLVRGA
jgi:nitroreductase